jgi:hypothetical protein
MVVSDTAIPAPPGRRAAPDRPAGAPTALRYHWPVIRRSTTTLAPAAWLLLLAVTACGPAGAQPAAALADAVVAAGQQRMLAERITKAWCLLGLGNENRQPRAQLFEAIERFEALLAELEGFLAHDPRLHPGLDELRRRWQPFERIAGSEPVRARALELLAAEEQVLGAGDRLARALVSQAGTPVAGMLDLAGRQAMLGQRLVKGYCFLAWGFDRPRVLDQFVNAWNDFEAAQAQLQAFRGNTGAVEDALASVSEEWGWLKSSLSLYRADLFYPGIIDDSGEKILDDIERLTGLYHGQIARAGAP